MASGGHSGMSRTSLVAPAPPPLRRRTPMAIDEKALDTALAKLEASAGLPIRRAVANAILAYEAYRIEALEAALAKAVATITELEAALDRAASPETESHGE